MTRARALGAIALGVAAALGGGVLIAGDTMGAVDPLYRYGREPRIRAVAVLEPAPGPPAAAFTPIAWSGFAASPPDRADPYDDPTLLDEPRGYREDDAPEMDVAPPEPEPEPVADTAPSVEPVEAVGQPTTTVTPITEQVAAPAPPLPVGE